MNLGKVEMKKLYRHQVPPAPLDPDYPHKYKSYLVTEYAKLELVLDHFLSLPGNYRCIAADTETNGLSPEEHSIVGFSFCYNGENGLYVPLYHGLGQNIDQPERALALFRETLKRATKVLFYNARFDMRMLKYSYEEIAALGYFDMMALTFLQDTNVKMPSLKWACKHFLGWSMQTFSEVTEGINNFEMVDPAECYRYAAEDASGTFRLFSKLASTYPQMRFVCDLDNRVLLPVMRMEDHPLKINIERLEVLREEASLEIRSVEAKIHSLAGREFNVGSTKTLQEILLKLGVPLTSRGKTGYSTGDAILEKLLKAHPIIPLIREWRSLNKLLDSYIEVIVRDYRKDLGGGRANYLLSNVPTGRMAASSDKKNPYFLNINIQAQAKPAPAFFLPAKTELTDPTAILGWRFTQCYKNEKGELPEGAVEGFDPKMNYRACFVPDPDHYLIHIDYAGEELRLAANMSHEPMLIEAFNKGEDLHKKVAFAMWGPEAYNKEKRILAKALNFGMLFGGSWYTIANTTGKPRAEAEDIVNRWWAVYPTLKAWVKACEREARLKGYTVNYFGRPRWVKHFYESSEFREHKYADRTVISHKIQGLGAELIKLALCKINDFVFPKYGKDISFHSCIHDELNFSVAREVVHNSNVIEDLVKCMELDIPEWPVKMTVDPAVGDSWGNYFSFEKRDGVWTPAA